MVGGSLHAVSATYAVDEEPHGGDPLRYGAAPHDIRAALLPEDRSRFDEAYATALEAARESLDLSELFRTLEQWRRTALLQRDPGNYGRVVRRAAELLTGESLPDDEPLVESRAKAGM